MEMKQVIFDFGGVLVDWNPQKIVERHTCDKDLQSAIRQEILGHPDWVALDRGTIDEHEAARRISQRSDISYSDAEDIFEIIRQSFEVIEHTVQLLRRLTERGVACYGLTNISGKNYDYLIAKHEFFGLLQGVVVSAHENLLKPEPAIYQLICTRYQLRASNTLFVDDMDENCLAANKAGLNSIRFEGVESCLQIEALLAAT